MTRRMADLLKPAGQRASAGRRHELLAEDTPSRCGLLAADRARARLRRRDQVAARPTHAACRARLGNAVLLKREDLQPVFSFKLRGAYNKIAQLPRPTLERGVICSSAGNHAQGVALAARKRGIDATIVMPKTAPPIKVEAVVALGGEVVLEGLTLRRREPLRARPRVATRPRVRPPVRRSRRDRGPGHDRASSSSGSGPPCPKRSSCRSAAAA